MEDFTRDILGDIGKQLRPEEIERIDRWAQLRPAVGELPPDEQRELLIGLAAALGSMADSTMDDSSELRARVRSLVEELLKAPQRPIKSLSLPTGDFRPNVPLIFLPPDSPTGPGQKVCPTCGHPV